MNAYDIYQTKKLKPLTEKETEYIFEEGIITGSYVYGEHTKGISDIDILLYKFNIDEIDDYENKIYIPENNENEYVLDSANRQMCHALSNKKELLNLLIFKEKNEFKVWRKTTLVMKKLDELTFMKKILKSRNKRIQLFKFFRNEFLK